MAYKEFGATIAPSNVSSSGFPIAMGTHIGGGRIVNDKTTLNLKHWCLLGEGATLNDQKANAIGQIWYDTSDNKYWKLNSWASENPVWVDVSTIFATRSYVDTAIDNIPDPMIFKGSLGTGGTITSLPTASTSNIGFTYKVITAGTYAGQVAKVGDTFISDGTIWNLIPSGDDSGGGSVTSITLNATSPILIDDSNAITTSGTRTFSHASTSGNKHIPSGGNSNNYLKWDSDGTATWSALPTASTSVAGVTTVGASGGAASYVHTHAKSDITDFAHTHAKSDITDFAHSHGNITNTGTISSTVITPASTDYILLSDTSNSGKVERGIAIGSSTSTYLRNDGTWVTPPDTNTTYSIFTTTTDGLVPKTTTSNTTDYLRRDGTWATPPNNNSTTHLYVGASGTTTNGTTTNGNTYIKLFDDSTAREQYKISGSGPSVVTSDATGNIIVGISDNSIGATQLNVTGNGTTTQYLRSDGDGSFTWADITSSNVTTALGYTPYNNTNPNGYTTNTGTVTNIVTGNGLTGGPITTTGTIGLAPTYGDTVNPYASKTAKWVLAAPNTADGVPSFRALVASDLPALNSITFNNGGAGDASGTTYNGSTARTISYNTIGAAASSHTHSTYVNQTLTSGNGMAAWTATNGDLTIALGTPSTITGSSTNSVTTTSHTHAVLITPADIGAAPSVHTHAKSDITDFAHTHGNITNAGAIGTTSGLMVKTTTSGVLTTLPAGTSGQFLQYDGTWAVPTGTYSLPLASNGTKGGIQIGYTATGANLPLKLDSEKGYITLTSSSITTALDAGYGDTVNPYGSKTAKFVLAAPNATNGVPSFRALVASDLPTAYGDSVNPYASKTAKYVLAAPNTADGVPSFRELVASDIPTLNQDTNGKAGSVSSFITFNNGGAGDASGTNYNGSTARTISYNTIGAVPSGRTITAGNGLTGGGNLTADRTLTLGTPGTLDNSTTNSVTSTSHTHAITFPNFYKADHSIVPSPNFNDMWGEKNNIWTCQPNMYNGVRDDFGDVDSNQMGDYSTSILIQYGTDPLKKMQMLFIDTSVSNVSMNGIFYRFRNSPWMRMLDTNDYNNLDQQITQWVTNNFEPKQTTASMPLPVGAGSVITITDAYINKFIKTTTPISNGTIEINYWKSYLETEIHLKTGATVPALSVDGSYEWINIPGTGLMPNTTYIIAIKNGVITFAKSI